MRSSIVVLAAAVGLAVAACDENAVASCMMPIISSATTCSDVPCVCSYLDEELACYTNLCPGSAIPAEATSKYDEICSGPYATATFPAAATTGADPLETATAAVDNSTEDSSTPTRGSGGSTATDSGETAITSAPAAGLGSQTTVGAGAQDKTTSTASTSTAAADMLLIPAGGMVAGLIGVLAWL